MAYNFTTYKLALQTLVVSQSSDVDFDNILPSAIDYAEQRIYRELNLLNTVQTKSGPTLTVGNRQAAIDSTFVVVNQINLLTPAGSDASSGVRVPLVPASVDVINTLWPGNSVTGPPVLYAMIDQWDMILGPSPDDTYALEVVGTYRPTPLSVANPTTFLTDHLPDLFLAAGMVFFSLYMRNFASAQGQAGNDPLMSGNWEAQYLALFASANTEEARKHGWGASWTAYPVSQQAQPQRG